MTTQTQPANNAIRPQMPVFSMQGSLKVLADTVESFTRFKREQGERLRLCKEMISRLNKRLETSEHENRRLKAQVQSLESDNGRLLRENDVFLRTQQTMDASILQACNSFHETAQFITDATRMTMPTLPSAFGLEEKAKSQEPQQPDISLVRNQPVTSIQVESDKLKEMPRPLEFVKPLPTPEITQEQSSVEKDLTVIDGIETMAMEIDEMLRQEFSDDELNAVTETQKSQDKIEDNTKAA